MALTFFWRAESTTFDGTHDFSAGDNTPTANETVEISSTQAFVGTNSVRAINGGDYYAFDSASIFSIAEGSAACSIYVNSSWAANGQFIQFINPASPNDHIHAYLSGTSGAGGIAVNIRQAGVANITIDTGDIGLAVDTWYSVVIRWHQSNEDIRVEVYDSGGSLLGSAENLSATGAFASGIDTFRIGESSGTNVEVFIDNIFVADAYSEDLESNLDIASYTNYGVGGGGGSRPYLGLLGVS